MALVVPAELYATRLLMGFDGRSVGFCPDMARVEAFQMPNYYTIRYSRVYVPASPAVKIGVEKVRTKKTRNHSWNQSHVAQQRGFVAR